jgi:long-chain acyl-CoA synthetase
LSDAVAEHARKSGNKVCVMLPDGRPALSYATLDCAATRFADFLRDRGCPRQGRLLIAIHNTPEFFVALLGAMRAGVVAIPIDYNLGPAELQKIVEHADPQAIVVNEASAAKLGGFAQKRILVGSGAVDGAVRFDPLAEGSETSAGQAVDVAPEELALILYTSGTTGLPKGVMHSHAGIARKLGTIRQWFGFNSSYRSLCLLPTHFGHGLICNCLSTLYYGGTLILCRPFDLDLVQKLWSYVEANGVNTFSTVPAIVRLLLRVAERSRPVSVPSLRFVTCASAPLRPEDIRAFERQFGVPLLNCYGITETASWTAFSPRAEAEESLWHGLDRVRDSVGVMFGCEIRAVDEAGNALPPDHVGELQIRGPSVMLGYYKNPEATAQVIKDGWFCSGDHGKVDQDGRVYLMGRMKELIIRAGLNVYPPDIDAVLLAHPEVDEAYTVGLEDPVLGERVAVAIVRKNGSAIGEEVIIEYCRGKVAAYKCPERVAFVDAIPKTSRGKVNRANLRPLFAGRR